MVERGEDQRAGRFDAADHLDDEVDVVAGDERLGVGGEQALGDVDVARRVDASYGDPDELDRRADAGLEVVGLLEKQADHLRPDGAAAQHGHLHRAGSLVSATAPMSVASRSSSVSRRSSTVVAPSRTATTGGRSAWL